MDIHSKTTAMKKLITIILIVLVSSCTGSNKYLVTHIEIYKDNICKYTLRQYETLAPQVHMRDTVGKFKTGDIVYITLKK